MTDFYRLRYTDARIMLLDFQRSAEQVFDPQQSVITDDGLLLGVRNKNVTMLSNEEGSVTAFTQEGALWTYAPDTGKFVDVFDFRRSANGDFRDSRVEHDIKLLSITADGDLDFMVYGYMNRGTYEGYCGVGIYHYDHDQNFVEERVFIPCTESFEFLKSDLGTLSYVNKDNQLFLPQMRMQHGGSKTVIRQDRLKSSTLIHSRREMMRRMQDRVFRYLDL